MWFFYCLRPGKPKLPGVRAMEEGWLDDLAEEVLWSLAGDDLGCFLAD
jgi:hypothetical protein